MTLICERVHSIQMDWKRRRLERASEKYRRCFICIDAKEIFFAAAAVFIIVAGVSPFSLLLL